VFVAGKKCPQKIRSNNFLSVPAGASVKPLVYIQADTIHSFTVSFLFKSRDNGTIAAVRGSNSQVSLALKNGRILYQSPGKEILSAE